MNEAIARLITAIASAALLVYAVATDKEVFAVVGAVLFLLGGALQVIDLFDASKRYRAGATDIGPNERPRGIADRIADWIGGVILFAGLAAFAARGKYDRGVFFVPGAIIWIGSIAIWVVSGVIARDVAGIPLRMGYGGWHIYRPRRRRKQGKQARGDQGRKGRLDHGIRERDLGRISPTEHRFGPSSRRPGS